MANCIRPAKKQDAAALLAIYAPYVQHTTISFETEVPRLAEFEGRIEAICEKYPFYVYEANGEIIGYAYADTHRARSAYRYNAELSVYVCDAYHNYGIASALYGCLFASLCDMGYYNAYAGVCVPNAKSEHFHTKMGFAPLGVFTKTGYKFGQWLDVLWMHKTLRPHSEIPKEPLPPSSLLPDVLQQTLALYATQVHLPRL